MTSDGSRLSNGLKNVVMMGVAFFLVIGGYGPAQSFSSTLLNFECLPLGEISIGIVYVFLALGSIVAPVVIRHYGVVKTMAMSSLCYGFFCLSLAYIVVPVVIIFAAALGICGAFLNIASGAAVTLAATPGNHGRYSGIFNAFNQGCVLPGNLLAIFLHAGGANGSQPRHCGETWLEKIVPGWSHDDSPLFLGCAGICFLGSLVLAVGIQPLAGDGKSSVLDSVRTTSHRIFTLAVRPSYAGGARLVLPLLFYSGISAAFWSGMFARQPKNELLPRLMLTLGCGEVIGSLLLGLVVDKSGLSSGSILVVIVQGGALSCALAANVAVGKRSDELFYAAAGLLGVADSAVYALCYAILTRKFGARTGEAELLIQEKDVNNLCGGSSSDDAFSLMMLINSIAVSVMFFVMPLAVSSSVDSVSPQAFLIECAAVFAILLVAASTSIWDAQIACRRTP